MNRHLTLAYILLVGFPVLVLFTILHSGRNLAAPAAMDGEWVVELDRPAPSAGALRWQASQLAFTIVQSGPLLLISLNDAERTVVTGALRASRVSAVSANGIQLEGTLAGTPGRRTMHGSVARCPSCPAMGFRAYRKNSRTNHA